jgi:FG-GAP repeat
MVGTARALALCSLVASACSGVQGARGVPEVGTRTSALSLPGHGPLVVGVLTNFPSGGLPDTGNINLFDPQAPTDFPSVSEFISGDEIAAGDLDGDGIAEIVRGASSPSGVGAGQFFIVDQQGLLRDPADFGFTGINALNQFSYAFGDKVAVGDVNGDGIGDIIIGVQTGTTPTGELFALTKAGSPSIDSNVLSNLGFTPGGGLIVCDVDHDGFDDVIVAPGFRKYSGRTGQITNYPLDSTGHIPQFFSGDKLACGDLNNDGFADVIVAHAAGSVPGTSEIDVFTDPSLAPITFFNNGIQPDFEASDEIAAGDIDGDGFAEIAIGHIPPTPNGGGPIFNGPFELFSAPGKSAPTVPQFFPVFRGGEKIAIPHIPGQLTSTTFTVPYVVQAILYQPPFDKSASNYATTSTISTSTSWGFSNSQGVFVAEKSGYASGGFSFTATQTDADTVTTTTTNSAGDGIHRGDTFCADPTTVCDASKDPDHTADQYVILFGATGHKDNLGNGQPSFILDLGTGTVRRFTVAQLQGLAKTPQDLTVFCSGGQCDADAQNIAQTFIQPSDAQQLVAADPYISGMAIDQHPERFEPACQTAGSCNSPESVFVDSRPAVPSTAADTTITLSHLQGNGSSVSSGSSTGLSMNVALFGVGVNASMTFNDVTTTSNFTAESASVTLENSSHCEKGTVNFWLDKAFGSFLWTTNLENACTTQPMKTMSFEDPSGWQMLQGNGTIALSNQAVSGDHSFLITASSGGWTPMASTPLSSSLLRSAATSTNLATVSFALEIPTAQPNPFWIGAAQMYITSPTANIFNAYMGQVELTGLPQGQFDRLEFTIPSNALPALSADNPDVSFTIVLNVNGGTTGWLIDDLQIGS